MKLSILHKVVFLSVILVVITTGAITVVYYFSGSSLLVNRELASITRSIENEGDALRYQLSEMKQDVVLLASLHATRESILGKGNENKTNAKWTTELFHELLHENKNYFQVRLLDNHGNEIVRVERNHQNEIIAASENKLQNKSSHNYFKKAINLKREQVYLSEINLNREFGKVATPHLPTIRASTPVLSEKFDKPIGVVVINMDIGQEFERLKQKYLKGTKEIIIANNKGGYLLHTDGAKTYSSDLGTQYRIHEDFPYVAQLFLPSHQDNSIILLPEQTLSSKAAVFTRTYFEDINTEHFIVIGIVEDYNIIKNEQNAVFKNNMWWPIVLVMLGTLLAFLFSLLFTRPLKTITNAIEEFGVSSSTNLLPIHRTDEFGVMARAFMQLFNQVNESQTSLHQLNENLESVIDQRTAELKSSEEKQRTILNTVVDGIITIDSKGTVFTMNPAVCEIFGYKEEELIGKNVKMLMPSAYADHHDQFLTNYMETGKAKIIGIGREVEGLRKNGETFPLDLAVSEMNVGGQRMFTGIVRDITERKRIDKMKNEFVSTVSHELRTPLTSIRGALGLITGGAAGEIPEKMKEMLSIAENNTQRLLVLINDILDTQKIESGNMSFKFAPMDVMPFVEQCLKDNSSYADQHFVRFIVLNRLDGAHIYADPDRMMQVMGNLLSNAAKFSPRGENIEVSVSHHNGLVRISVTDHGVGIPEDFKNKVFDKFSQSDSSDTRTKGGTGLGLSISKLIIEKHGGNIGFVSHQGVGTTFYIELPEYNHKTESEQNINNPGTNKEHEACMLIVEDDHDIAALMQRMVVEAGITADIAYDTEQAREYIKKFHKQYRVITLDIRLPGEDGISLMNWIRNQPEFCDLPVVVVSVEADENRRKLNGSAIGVVDWINKPIDEKRLLNAIKQSFRTNGKTRILHVEDEQDVLKVVGMMLQDEADITQAVSLRDSRELLSSKTFDLVLLDIGLPDGSGLDLLEDINQLTPAPQVIIFSALDVSAEYVKQVAAVLSKSKTSNKALLETIKRFVEK